MSGDPMTYYTKIRPGAIGTKRPFHDVLCLHMFPYLEMLQKLSDMYELHVYTLGTRRYAAEILR